MKRSAELPLGANRRLKRAEPELGAPLRLRDARRGQIQGILSRITRFCFASVLALAALLPATASACASCFGQSDSPMAKGMNAGIFTLLFVITSVLLGVAIFFAYILRRASRLSGAAAREAEPLAPARQSVTQTTH